MKDQDLCNLALRQQGPVGEMEVRREMAERLAVLSPEMNRASPQAVTDEQIDMILRDVWDDGYSSPSTYNDVDQNTDHDRNRRYGNLASDAIKKLRALLSAQPSSEAPDSEEDAFVIDKLAKLLAGVCIALKGPEIELHRHSYHDIVEVAEHIKLELDLYRAQAAAQPQEAKAVAAAWTGKWKDCPFPHNFGKPLGFAVVTNADTKFPNMLDGGAHTFRREAQAVADRKEYAGTHHVVELWPSLPQEQAPANPLADDVVWRVIGEMYSAATPITKVTVKQWAGDLETSHAATYEDIYGQCCDTISPLVDAGKLPRSLVESVQILVDGFSQSQPQQVADD